MNKSSYYLNLNQCILCGNNCTINHNSDKSRCNNQRLLVARASLHTWEEPVISGHRGSGTIFFSGCNLSCIYCQNRNISQQPYGLEISVNRLAEIFYELESLGAHNINLVSPTHYVPKIIEALEIYRPNIPIVYNTGGYDTIDTINMLDGYVDIYIPDCKYASEDIAFELSQIHNYPSINQTAISQMITQVGKPKLTNGIMTKGVIVRHLILPNYIQQSMQVLDKLSQYKDDIMISLMSQYVPLGMDNYPLLNRPITKLEYKAVLLHMDKLGITNGYIQELTSANSTYIPDFDLTGV